MIEIVKILVQLDHKTNKQTNKIIQTAPGDIHILVPPLFIKILVDKPLELKTFSQTH